VTERSLPDDLSLWPTNPYELLGVPRHVTERVARRAYLNLIRRYKPEHSPEQFKRIREAYEFVDRVIKSQSEHNQSSWEEDDYQEDKPYYSANLSDEWEQEPPKSDETVQQGSFQAASPRPAIFDLQQECQVIWRQLCEGGNPTDAYARLRAWQQRFDNNGVVYLRLYWLTVASPDVETEFSPCHWLSEGLRITRLDDRLRELYQRELDANPHEAAHPRCTALLELDAPLGAIVDLAEARWRALARIGRSDLLMSDLQMLRGRIIFDEEELWGRLLLSAMDHLVWINEQHSQDAALACRRELDELSHVHASLENDIDRLDLLWDVAAGWRRLRVAFSIPRHWSELIPISWSRNYQQIRPALMNVVQDIARDPMRSLGITDEIARHCPAAVAQLGFTIEAYQYVEENYEYDRRSDDERSLLVQRFINERDCSNYRAIRRDVLQFCLVEAIEPTVFAQIADEIFPAQWTSASWQDLLADDAPLRCVAKAYQTFWS
jgi:hypothetical protein